MSVEFIDTNVLVYAHDVTAGKKFKVAGDLVGRLLSERAVAVSVQVLLEFFITVTRKVSKPLSWEQAREILADLSNWPLFAPDGQDVLEAVNISSRYDISVWDAMIVQAAIRMGASMIWTEDLNSGQLYEGVEVRNPFLSK